MPEKVTSLKTKTQEGHEGPVKGALSAEGLPNAKNTKKKERAGD